MTDFVTLYIGYDPREAAAYHVFCQSVIEHTSIPVAFIPLAKPWLRFDGQRDGSNAFIYSRYLIPHIQDHFGWALFVDGDMVVRSDLSQLWDMRDDRYAVQLVKHDYKTKHPRKYVGTPMESDNMDYPRKNWSSVVLWNCGHKSNRVLTRDFVEDAGGSFLHRFQWLKDEEIGSLPGEWNHLVGEQEQSHPRLVHYTLGIPAIKHYQNCDYANDWFKASRNAFHVEG